MKGGSATSAIAHWKISQYKSESHNWPPISNISLIEFDNNIPPSACNKYRNRKGERGGGKTQSSVNVCIIMRIVPCMVFHLKI